MSDLISNQPKFYLDQPWLSNHTFPTQSTHPSVCLPNHIYTQFSDVFGNHRKGTLVASVEVVITDPILQDAVLPDELLERYKLSFLSQG